MTVYAIITIVTLLTVFTVLIKTSLPSDIVFLFGLMVLLVTGAVDTPTALSGFSSSAVVRVGVLFVVAAGLYWSGVLKWAVKHIITYPKNYFEALVKIMPIAAVLSAVMSDNTVVVIFTKVMKMWAKKINVAVSKLLIPMTSAAQIGGILTIISSTPNVVVAGLYHDHTQQNLGFFSITPSAVICFITLCATMLLFRKLLPDRTNPDEGFEKTEEYTVEMLVPSDCPHIGQTVTEAGLLSIKGGGHLIEIVRFDKEIITPVAEDEFIMGGDRLIFTGKIPLIEQLKASHGLVASTNHVFSVEDVDNSQRKVTAAMVKFNSNLIGKTITKSGFEKKNGIVVVALSRNGQRIDDSPRNIPILGGDTLLIEMQKKEAKEVEKNLKLDFVITANEDLIETGPKTVLSSIILVAMVIVTAMGILPMLEATMLAAAAMLVLKCCTPKQAQESVKWDILLVFAASIVFGKAIEQNGIADIVVQGILSLSGESKLLTITLLATAMLITTEIISNTAVAALFFPIVLNTSQQTGMPLEPLCYLLMLCASLAVATPTGSSVNTLIYGPGGYKFSDYFILGIPQKIVALITTVATIYLLYL